MKVDSITHGPVRFVRTDAYPHTVRNIKVKRSAPQLLAEAAEIMQERGKQYDQPEGERSMGKTVAAFNAITSHELRESEGWLLLELLKNVRTFGGQQHHEDSLLDGVSYAALKAECALAEIAAGTGGGLIEQG